VRSHPILDLIEQIQGLCAHRAQEVRDNQPHDGCSNANIAVEAELMALVGRIQDIKAETARALQRKGIRVDSVPTIKQIIEEQEKQK
jgi:hypothetical protein